MIICQICSAYHYAPLHTIDLAYYHLIMIYSLEEDQFEWTEIGDEGATALADLRVIKNFTTLK